MSATRCYMCNGDFPEADITVDVGVGPRCADRVACKERRLNPRNERAERAEARVAELEAAICRHVRAREGESSERPDMTVAVLYRIEHEIKAREARTAPSVSEARKP